MKRITTISTIFFLLLFGPLFAQQQPWKFGVKIGINASNASVSNDGADPNVKIGYQVGATAGYFLSKSWLIESGLAFATKGSKIDSYWAGKVIGRSWEDEINTYNLMYLQVPINLGCVISVSNNVSLLFSAGPYFAYGVGGKAKYEFKYNSTYEVEFNAFEGGSNVPRLERFDWGLGFGVSAIVKKIVIGLNCEFGFRDIGMEDRYNYNSFSYKNQSAALTIGYRF